MVFASDRDAFSGVETLIGDGKLSDFFFGEGAVEHDTSRTAKEMKAHCTVLYKHILH